MAQSKPARPREAEAVEDCPPLSSDHRASGLSDSQMVELYSTMVLARAVDQKIWNLQRTKSDKVPFMIPGQGQEAAQVGSARVLRVGHDVALPYYRDYGVVLSMGMTPVEVMLNAFARPSDPNSGGRQMPSHWGCRRLNMISCSSPIGTQLPHAAGLANAAKLADDGRIVVCWFGEAAASKGDYHEALNYAGIHRLPLVLVCENNGYAISVPQALQTAVPHVADQMGAYGIRGEVVDGDDPIAVYQATKAAAESARAGEGPVLVEAMTYRLRPHTSDDDDRPYRSRSEVSAARARDTLVRTRNYVLGAGLLTEDEDKALTETITAEVQKAAREAEAAPDAQPSDAYRGVYARQLRPIARVPATVAQVVEPPIPSPSPTGEGTVRNVLETIRTTLGELMEADERVMILGEDVGRVGGVFRATEGLQERFGEGRVVDTPLSESGIAGIGIGLAMAGLRPVVEIQFADFIHACFDQLVNEAAKMYYRTNGDWNVPLVVRTPWGGGTHRAIYHSQSVEVFYAHVAGMKVVCPSTPADVAGLLREAVNDPDPVLFLEHKRTYRHVKGEVPPGEWRVPIGVADVARPGDDLTVVTYGLHRHICLEAAEVAAGEGFSVEVIDLRTISPLDRDAVLSSVARTGRLLVVHEDNGTFGVGAEIAAMVAEELFYDLDAPVRRLAMADVPALPYNITQEAELLIETAHVVGAIRSCAAE